MKEMSGSIDVAPMVRAFMEEPMKGLTPEDILSTLVFMDSTEVIAEDGTEIFTGDIVERICTSPNCPMKHRGVVVYDPILAQYSIKEKEGISPLVIASIKDHTISSVIGITKLGNIYQNPELVDKETLRGIV